MILKSLRLIENSALTPTSLSVTSTLAGKVMVFFTPCRSSTPVTVWVAPPGPPGLISVEVKVALGYLPTSKKSADFRCPVSFWLSASTEPRSISTMTFDASGFPPTKSILPLN